VTLVYGHRELSLGLLASFIWGEASNEETRVAIRSYFERLVQAAPNLPGGERRRCRDRGGLCPGPRALNDKHARAREPGSSPFAFCWGIRDSRTSWVRSWESKIEGATPLTRTTRRGRYDWTKNFFVSAALTVLSAQAPSDAIGLFKEELEAGAGSASRSAISWPTGLAPRLPS
jgi:hypothetical protein